METNYLVRLKSVIDDSCRGRTLGFVNQRPSRNSLGEELGNIAEETHKMREAVDPLKPQEWQTLPKK